MEFSKIYSFFCKKIKKNNFFIASLNSGEKVNSVFWNPDFCWIFNQRVRVRSASRTAVSGSSFGASLGFQATMKLTVADLTRSVAFCKPIGKCFLHSGREFGYGEACFLGIEREVVVLQRITALQC